MATDKDTRWFDSPPTRLVSGTTRGTFVYTNTYIQCEHEVTDIAIVYGEVGLL